MNASAATVPAASIVPARIQRAMPAWTYDHPQMTRLEQERILTPSWQIVCHVNSIPAPGDFITLDVGPESVVAVRAFSRGAAIVRGASPAHIMAGLIVSMAR